ncbi:MAG: ABC transporter ATP-binding protein [Planctomycetota bacterium]|nr:ABC transporter ATP-binding protein [Planctomycetota bacterium]
MVPIVLDAVSKSYGSVRVVEEVSVRIEPGELFFLLGGSGCGKTTILRMIAGFLSVSSGRILFGDEDVTHLSPEKRRCGMVFQSYALWPHMTVEQNIAFGLEVAKVKGPERTRRVGEAMALVRMSEYAQRKPNELSGGQQQRVALARAVAFGPRILLLDEPLSNLDAKLRTEMRTEILTVCKHTGMTAVYVTHDQDEALSMADRMAVMQDGRFEQVGPPRLLYDQPRTRFLATFLGETNLLPAQVSGGSTGGTVATTPVGQLRLRSGVRDGRVILSLRPEAIHIVEGMVPPGMHELRDAICQRSTDLGSVARHSVLCGSMTLEVFEPNPRHGSRVGQLLRLAIDPNQVAVLEDEPSTVTLATAGL